MCQFISLALLSLTSSNSPNLSVPQFPHLQKDSDNNTWVLLLDSGVEEMYGMYYWSGCIWKWLSGRQRRIVVNKWFLYPLLQPTLALLRSDPRVTSLLQSPPCLAGLLEIPSSGLPGCICSLHQGPSKPVEHAVNPSTQFLWRLHSVVTLDSQHLEKGIHAVPEPWGRRN